MLANLQSATYQATAQRDVEFCEKIIGQQTPCSRDDRERLKLIAKRYAGMRDDADKRIQELRDRRGELERQLGNGVVTKGELDKEILDRKTSIYSMRRRSVELEAQSRVLVAESENYMSKLNLREEELDKRAKELSLREQTVDELARSYFASQLLTSIGHSVTMKHMDIKLRIQPRVHIRLKKLAMKFLQEIPKLREDLNKVEAEAAIARQAVKDAQKKNDTYVETQMKDLRKKLRSMRIQVRSLEEESQEIERISWDAEDRLQALLQQADEYYQYIQEKQRVHQEFLVSVKNAQIQLAKPNPMTPVRRGIGAVPIAGSKRRLKPEEDVKALVKACEADRKLLDLLLEKLRVEGRLLKSITETQILECSLRADKQLPKEGVGTLDFLDYDRIVLGKEAGDGGNEAAKTGAGSGTAGSGKGGGEGGSGSAGGKQPHPTKSVAPSGRSASRARSEMGGTFIDGGSDEDLDNEDNYTVGGKATTEAGSKKGWLPRLRHKEHHPPKSDAASQTAETKKDVARKK